MTEQELLEKFKELGVLKTGHFRLTSGCTLHNICGARRFSSIPKLRRKLLNC